MSQPKKSDSTLFSPLSIAITLILLAALGIILWQTGGVTFSPGQVSAKGKTGVSLGKPGGKQFTSHAQFEGDCKQCHQPLEGVQVVGQSQMCVACHADISTEMAHKTGTHGYVKNAAACAECHKEHLGRDYDPTAAALANFDHNQTHFVLDGKHIPLKCADCHQPKGAAVSNFELNGGACVSCHAEPAAHAGLLGADCVKCHTSFGWRPAQQPPTAATAASAATSAPDAAGKQPTQSTSAKPQTAALFDHTRQFVLIHHQVDYAGKELACGACHTADPQTHALRTDLQLCQDCHAGHDADFMGKHTAQFGANCLDCHDGADRLENFKHENFFALDGKHADLPCAQCHANGYRNTPAACADCHTEPAVHTGTFGKKCQFCHAAAGWLPAALRLHTFPLDHGTPGAESACKTCHPDTDTVYTCFTCHDHQLVPIQASHLKLKVTGPALLACADCHPRGK